MLLKRDELTQPLDRNGQTHPFEIDMGESVGSISYRLEAGGFIPDADAFRTYLVYSGKDTSLQAGKYSLNPAMTPLEIAQELQDATPGEVTFSVLEGWRIEEIAAALPTSGLSFQPEEFFAMTLVHPPDLSFTPALPESVSLEGFFFPGQYRFRREISLQEFVYSFFQNFDTQVTPDIRQGFTNQGLDLFQAVTLASIVQREAVVIEEQPIIASVFFNRLSTGMKLDSDPTVQYAVGFNPEQNSWWTNPLSVSDLQINSPYNTYIFAGLPPGPIASPGLSALKAVAFPAQTPYFYFQARCDGSGRHEFAETYEQHLQNSCQ